MTFCCSLSLVVLLFYCRYKKKNTSFVGSIYPYFDASSVSQIGGGRDVKMNFLFWKSAPKPSADSKSSSKDSGSKSPLTRIAQIVVQRHILPCLAVNDIIFSLIRVNRATTQLLCISCSDTWRVWVYERFTAQTISRFLQQSGGLILPLDCKSAIANAPSSAAAKSNTSPPPNEWHVVNKSILASSFAVDHGGCGAGKLLLTAAKSSDQAAGFWYRMFYSIRRFQLMESRHRSSRPASSKKGNLVAKLIVIGVCTCLVAGVLLCSVVGWFRS